MCLVQGRIAAFDPGSVGGRNLRIAEADLRKSGLSAHFESKVAAVTSFCVYRSGVAILGCTIRSLPENGIISENEQVIVIFSRFCKAPLRGMMAAT
jgi:hypothetical protein